MILNKKYKNLIFVKTRVAVCVSEEAKSASH